MKVLKISVDFTDSYLQLDLNSLKLDESLVFDIYFERKNTQAVVIEAGTKLSTKLYDYLKQQEKLYISIMDTYLQEFTCETLYFYVKYNKNDPQKSLNFIYDINNILFTNFLNSKDDLIDLSCLEEILQCVVFLVKNNPHYLRETIPHFKNDYTLAYHSLHVSIYAISLGNFLKLNDNELLQIGKAGMLIDIGNKDVNSSIKDKDSKLTPEEEEEIHKHTKYSIDIAKKNNIDDDIILDAIKHHHERHDTTGYPDHLESKYISNFASILAICDVLDALTSDRPYRKKYSTFNALKIMMEEQFMAKKLNQKYIKVFLQSFLK